MGHIARIHADEEGDFFVDEPVDGVVHHVYPCGPDGTTDHEVDGEPCWCGPTVYVLCNACDPDGPDPACWRCAGDGVVVDDGQYREPDSPVMVVHNDRDREE